MSVMRKTIMSDSGDREKKNECTTKEKKASKNLFIVW